MSIIFFISTNLTLSVNWFYSNGMCGSIPFGFLTFLAFVFFLFEGRLKLLMVFLLIFNVILLFFLEYNFNHLVVNYESYDTSFADHLIAFISAIPLIAIAITYSQHLYEKEKLSNEKLIEQYRQSSQYLRQQANDQLLALSIREREVFQRIIEGKSNKEIADMLNVEVGTIKTHINNIYKKLDVKNRSEISKFQGVKTAG